MILRILAVLAAAESAHRQVEPGRAELALVISVRREIDDTVRAAGFGQRPRDGPVDGGVAASAALVRRVPAVAEPGQDEAVLDAVDGVAVAGEPGDRPDGAGNEQDPVGVPVGPVRERHREQCGHGHPGGVVVRHAGVTGVGGDKELRGAGAGQQDLRVCQ
jgi:hypothetical protein